MLHLYALWRKRNSVSINARRFLGKYQHLVVSFCASEIFSLAISIDCASAARSRLLSAMSSIRIATPGKLSFGFIISLSKKFGLEGGR
jgi:hypothetical protein